MCVSVLVYGWHKRPGIRSLGAEVTDGCELPDVDDGKQTLAVYENSVPL